jgi:hypothetical protein
MSFLFLFIYLFVTLVVSAKWFLKPPSQGKLGLFSSLFIFDIALNSFFETKNVFRESLSQLSVEIARALLILYSNSGLNENI